MEICVCGDVNVASFILVNLSVQRVRFTRKGVNEMR